jgi:hypothetical protein
LQERIHPDWFTKYRPSLNVQMSVDVVKATCLIALQSVISEFEQSWDGLEFLANPKVVRATRPYAKEKLTLVPATRYIVAMVPSRVNQSHIKLCTVKPPLLKNEMVFTCASTGLPKDTDLEGEGFVAPFWHVKYITTKKDATMKWSAQEIVRDGVKISVPLLVNKKALDIGCVLTCYDEEKDKKEQKAARVAEESALKKQRT